MVRGVKSFNRGRSKAREDPCPVPQDRRDTSATRLLGRLDFPRRGPDYATRDQLSFCNTLA
jgi:hypothetical protein